MRHTAKNIQSDSQKSNHVIDHISCRLAHVRARRSGGLDGFSGREGLPSRPRACPEWPSRPVPSTLVQAGLASAALQRTWAGRATVCGGRVEWNSTRSPLNNDWWLTDPVSQDNRLWRPSGVEFGHIPSQQPLVIEGRRLQVQKGA